MALTIFTMTSVNRDEDNSNRSFNLALVIKNKQVNNFSLPRPFFFLDNLIIYRPQKSLKSCTYLVFRNYFNTGLIYKRFWHKIQLAQFYIPHLSPIGCDFWCSLRTPRKGSIWGLKWPVVKDVDKLDADLCLMFKFIMLWTLNQVTTLDRLIMCFKLSLACHSLRRPLVGPSALYFIISIHALIY